jgi:hypothetical protein
MTAPVRDMSRSYYSINCGSDYIYSLNLDIILCNSYDPATHTLIYITESVPLDVDISGGCPGCPFLTIKCLFCYCIEVTCRFFSIF